MNQFNRFFPAGAVHQRHHAFGGHEQARQQGHVAVAEDIQNLQVGPFQFGVVALHTGQNGVGHLQNDGVQLGDREDGQLISNGVITQHFHAQQLANQDVIGVGLYKTQQPVAEVIEAETKVIFGFGEREVEQWFKQPTPHQHL